MTAVADIEGAATLTEGVATGKYARWRFSSRDVAAAALERGAPQP